MLQNFNADLVQNIDTLAGNETGLRAYYVACAKRAEKDGKGTFVDGRRGNPSRFIPAGASDPWAKGPLATETLEMSVSEIAEHTGQNEDLVIHALKSGGRFIVGRKGKSSRYVWGVGTEGDAE